MVTKSWSMKYILCELDDEDTDDEEFRGETVDDVLLSEELLVLLYGFLSIVGVVIFGFGWTAGAASHID